MKYLLLTLAKVITCWLPRRIGYGIARRIADVYFLVDRRGRENVIQNLSCIYGHAGTTLSYSSLRRLARGNFLNFAKYLVDFFHFLSLKPEALNRLIDFGNVRPVLDELLGHGKGVIFISAHLGNWELGAGALATLGYKINAVALWQPDPRLNALYQKQRAARQLTLIPMGRAARECVAALRRNEVVALVGDRDFTGSRNTVDFFGNQARLPDGPAKLSLATGTPILPIFLVRKPDDTYQFVLDNTIWPDKTKDSLQDVMGKIATSLERIVSNYSDQWFLFHDLWDVEKDRVLATVTAFGEPPADAKEELIVP